MIRIVLPKENKEFATPACCKDNMYYGVVMTDGGARDFITREGEFEGDFLVKTTHGITQGYNRDGLDKKESLQELIIYILQKVKGEYNCGVFAFDTQYALIKWLLDGIQHREVCFLNFTTPEQNYKNK